jgi:hypothetical protein
VKESYVIVKGSTKKFHGKYLDHANDTITTNWEFTVRKPLMVILVLSLLLLFL